MFGTKLRALLQRNKNRDLFDLHHGMVQLELDPDKLIACLDHYLALEGRPITRAVAEQRMLEKLTRSLTEDITPLLPTGVRFDDNDAMQAFERVWTDLISRCGREGEAPPAKTRSDPWPWVGGRIHVTGTAHLLERPELPGCRRAARRRGLAKRLGQELAP